VSFESYRLKAQGRLTRETELRQVLAVLPGKSARRIYVTAHYDTLNLPGQTAKIVRPSPLPAGFDAQAARHGVARRTGRRSVRSICPI